MLTRLTECDKQCRARRTVPEAGACERGRPHHECELACSAPVHEADGAAEMCGRTCTYA